LSETFNIAQVQGLSGTFVAPAHSPYDRQIVREHVERLAGHVSTLTLGLHGTRWTITRRSTADSRCTSCTQPLGRLSCRRGSDADASCIDCALRPGATKPLEESAHE
jgi:hypothetical protein